MGVEPLYPEVVVPMLGEDGNAFMIIGRVSVALKRAGHGDVVDQFRTEAMAGDYDHVLQTVLKYVTAE